METLSKSFVRFVQPSVCILQVWWRKAFFLLNRDAKNDWPSSSLTTRKRKTRQRLRGFVFFQAFKYFNLKNTQSWYFVVAAELVAIRRLYGRRRQGVRIPTLDVCAINSYSSAETSGLRKLKNFTLLPIVSNQNWRFIYRKSYPHACIQVRHL